MSRRIMRSFKLNEISAVDRPAQKGARMTILKRDDGNDPLRTASPHHVEKGILDMTPEEVKKMIDDAVKVATADLTKKLSDTETALATITKAAKKKPAADDGDPEPDADDATQKAWRPYVAKMVAKAVADTTAKLEADFAKREAVIKGDEVLTMDGVTIRKSETTESNFAFMKAQADRIEIADFTKRAETEIPTLVGEMVAKAKALRAVSKLGEDDRKVIEAMLKGGEAMARLAMKSKGHDTTTVNENTATGQLNKMATDYATTHKVDFAKAYSAVIETPAGQELYAKAETERKAAVKAA